MTHTILRDGVRLDVLSNRDKETNMQFTVTYGNVRTHATNVEIRFYNSGNIKLSLWEDGIIEACVELSDEEAKEVEKTVKEHSKDARNAIKVQA